MIKIFESWKHYILLGLLIMLLALVLRLYNLDNLPVFGDEAIYVRWAQIMRNEPTLRFIPLSDGKQPLFMWVIIPFQKIISDPVIAGRIVSVYTGMGTMVGIFVLTVILFPSSSKRHSEFSSESRWSEILKQVQDDKNVIKVGLIAALIYAISPFVVFFDRMALVDSMLTMFGVWTFIFSYLSFRYIRLDFSLLAGFTLGFAFLTKSPALFYFLLLPSIFLLVNWPTNNKKRIFILVKRSFLLLITYILSLGIMNILRLGSNFHMIGQRNLDYVHPISRLLIYPTDPLKVFFLKIVNFFWLMGPAMLVVLFILGVILSLNKYRKEILILLVWSLGPILVISEFSKTMTARYVMFTIPFIIIIAASLYLHKGKYLKKILMLGLVLFVLQSMLLNYKYLTNIEAANLPRSERSGYLEEWTSGTGIREVADLLAKEYSSSPEERIVVGTEGYFGPLPDGLQAYLYDHPEITIIGIGTNIREVPEQLRDSKLVGNKTYLVINDSRLVESPGNLGLKLLEAYPKAFRPEDTDEYKHMGPRETLYLFEVTEKSLIEGGE